MQSRAGFLMAVAAAMLLVGVTILQGWWTERWAVREDRALEKAAQRLEQSFPESFGDWKMDRRLETSKAELDRAGAVGSISRIYRNTKTRTLMSAFVVCATPHDASGHTPDRCYPGAGFEIAEPEHRETIHLTDGRVAEAYTGTFAKQGQTLRVFWTYGVPDKKAREAEEVTEAPVDGAEPAPKAPVPLTWVAPQIARIALNDFPAVYKLYAIVDQTKMTPSRARAECDEFIGQVLPAFEAAVAAEAAGRSKSAAEPAAAEPASEPAGAAAG